MMDANNDWLDKISNIFRAFVDEMQLTDPLHKKFGSKSITNTIYSKGSRQIDFTQTDSSIEPVIKKIGTLDLH